MLGPVGDDKFTYLKDVGRLITDFSQPDEEPGVPGDTLDDDIGVAVEFEGDEDADEESEVDEVEVCCCYWCMQLNTDVPLTDANFWSLLGLGSFLLVNFEQLQSAFS